MGLNREQRETCALLSFIEKEPEIAQMSPLEFQKRTLLKL